MSKSMSEELIVELHKPRTAPNQQTINIAKCLERGREPNRVEQNRGFMIYRSFAPFKAFSTA